VARSPGTWLWGGIALLASVLGSALIARLINRPLQELSFAASRIREGEYDSRLDENTMTSEIREVNIGFNRMARELAKVEEDRAVMLAGISHDLRTPLARLRLEAEMSVADEAATWRRHRPARRHHRQVHGLRAPGDVKLRRCTCQPGRARDGGLPRHEQIRFTRAWRSTPRCWPTRPNSAACC
jgi:signal transduction histidine kinase